VNKGMAGSLDFRETELKGPNPKNSDTSTYLPRWQDKWASLQEQWSKDPRIQRLSPAAQKDFKVAMDRINIDATSRVGIAANAYNTNNATATFTTDMKMAIKAKDQPTAMAANDYMEKNALIWPEQAAANRIAIPQEIQENDARDEINGDYTKGSGPVITIQRLQAKTEDGKNYADWPDLTTEQREQLLNQARYGLRIVQGQVSEKYAGYIGAKAIVNPDEVRMDMALGVLPKSEGLSLLKPPKPADDNPTGYAETMTAIGKIDPSNPDWSARYDIGRSINNMTGVNQEMAKETFKRAVSGGDDKSPLFRYGIQAIDAAATVGHVYGNWETEVPAHPENKLEMENYSNGFGVPMKKVVDPAAYEKAMAEKAQTITALQVELAKDPATLKTQADVQNFVAAHHADALRSRGASLLDTSQAIPPAADVNAVLDHLGYKSTAPAK
jgi:hypothetical protein